LRRASNICRSTIIRYVKHSDLDIVRACLQSSGESIHYNRLAHLSELACNVGDIGKSLEKLTLLGECIALGRGYWAVCPDRNVRVGNEYLLISSLTTPRLAREYEVIEAECIGRFSHTPLYGCPVIELPNYLKIPSTLQAWLHWVTEQLGETFAPSSQNIDELLIYDPRPSSGVIASSHWLEAHKVADRFSRDYFLARSSRDLRSVFWGRFESGRLLESLRPVSSVARARFALEQRSGAISRSVEISTDGDLARIDAFFSLPDEEKSFFLVAGRVENLGTRYSYFVSKRHLPVVHSILAGLNIKF
jgi:hypothetical protein